MSLTKITRYFQGKFSSHIHEVKLYYNFTLLSQQISTFLRSESQMADRKSTAVALPCVGLSVGLDVI